MFSNFSVLFWARPDSGILLAWPRLGAKNWLHSSWKTNSDLGNGSARFILDPGLVEQKIGLEFKSVGLNRNSLVRPVRGQPVALSNGLALKCNFSNLKIIE